MATAALGLFIVYLAIVFGLRAWLQVRATGDSGFRGVSGRPGTAEWWGGLLFGAALAAGLLGPAAALLGLAPVDELTSTVVQGVGIGLTVGGIALTFATQVAMGTNWRVGVDEAERTELVTTGPFAVVRNPIFTAMTVTALGLALMVPNVVAIVGLVLLVIALQLQVRVVEEPYLRRTHGDAYSGYAATTGRFVPGLGRVNRLNQMVGKVH